MSYVSYMRYVNYMSIFMNNLSDSFFTIYKDEFETSKI